MISKLYKHQDNLYKILREIKISSFEKGGMDLVKEFRDYLGADHVLQTQTHFMFCETIQDAEIIEETIN